ncbi:MAG: serine/threonine-protein phosphatase [Gammaproteobacteria bacterium]|nr:serine/threonine-protein phosphatase [Gammaproteobacteria bacterium]
MLWQCDIACAIGGRAEQQDRVESFAVPNRPEDCLVVLADGMGGQRDGGLAAQLVIDTARQAVADTPVEPPQQFLDALCRRADQAIVALGQDRGSQPGSTCVLLYLSGGEAYWAHAGDSRLYHFAGRQQLSCTRDHTFGELRREAAPGPTAAAADDASLYMCLGGQNPLAPELGASATGRDDWFLLCSDGFWNQVTPAELDVERRDAPTSPSAAEEWVRLAAARGGQRSDNVSVALVTRRRSAIRRLWSRLRTPD